MPEPLASQGVSLPAGFPRRRRRGLWLPLIAAGLLLAACLVSLHGLTTAGLRAYRERARPELVVGQDRMTRRNAAFVRLGLLHFRPAFCEPADLAADTPEARRLFGQALPAPPASRLPGQRPPSTELLPPARENVPTDFADVSLVCRAADLFDPDRGIVARPFDRGDAAERVAWVSARVGGQIVLETPVGLRVHGGSSRVGPMKSFSLNFRERHGGYDHSPPGLFFGPDAPAVRRLLLITAYEGSQFNNILATEIAGRLGCRVSRAVPARLTVNGTEIPAPYFLVEHQSPDYVANHDGFDHVEWHRLKSEEEPPDSFTLWRKWQRRTKDIDLAEEASRFDLDDLCAWVLAITFTSTTDNDQGAYYRDASVPDAPWRCLTWDLDAAFNTGLYIYKERTVDCSRQAFEILVGERGILFYRLIAGSPEFREQFRTFARQKLEKDLPPDALLALVDRHIAQARALPHLTDEALPALERSRAFLATRHQAYFALLDELLDRAARGEAEYFFSPQPSRPQ